MPADPAPLAAPPAPAVRALACPACGAAVSLRAAGYSVTAGCTACGSILDVSDPLVKLVTQYSAQALALEIPLGTRGTLDGIEWEAIGYLARSIDGSYPWDEYLLFNPYHGYRWLVTDGQSWSLGETQTASPQFVTYDTLGIGETHFRRFFSEREARVDRVLGEFYWRVAIGERVVTSEWAAPGHLLSREANANEVSWTVQRLLAPREIAAAFGVDAARNPWPPPPHMPSPHARSLGTWFKIGSAAMAFLLLLTLFMSGGAWRDAGWLRIASDGSAQTATVGPLQFTQPWQRVEIRARVPRLENGWVDFDYALVDRTTQQVYEAYGAAERYSGRDSDGDWTEGSRRSQISIASVPRGTYDLVVEYRGNRWITGEQYGDASGWMSPLRQPEVKVEVRRGGVYASNLIIALLFILLPFLWTLARHARFEQARQAESDYDPTGVAAIFKESEDDE
ncbi:DUF4178 domain-containing protein [Sphingomonas sp. LT1P40]|uniref:DUF4178 domain-containing protein n=1 Tax=Alteristakelama amylovorans TaxID=3096166 RepID=UPI002FC5D0A2